MSEAAEATEYKPETPDGVEGAQEEQVIGSGSIIIFLMLIFFMVAGNVVEEYELSFGHEASFTVCMGMVISLYELKYNSEMVKFLKFDDNAFFFLCLPPIVFASGFNMRR